MNPETDTHIARLESCVNLVHGDISHDAWENGVGDHRDHVRGIDAKIWRAVMDKLVGNSARQKGVMKGVMPREVLCMLESFGLDLAERRLGIGLRRRE